MRVCIRVLDLCAAFFSIVMGIWAALLCILVLINLFLFLNHFFTIKSHSQAVQIAEIVLDTGYSSHHSETPKHENHHEPLTQ